MKRNVSTQYTCEVCGKPFISPYGKRFCSPSCRTKGLNPHGWSTAPKPERHCVRCGTIITKRLAKFYCSFQCRNEANAKQKQRNGSVCVKCGKYVTYHRKSPLCNDCLPKKPKRTIKGISAAGRKKISERMRANNPMKRPEVQAKVRAWWANNPDAAENRDARLLEGKQRLQKTKVNKLELKLQAILAQLGLNFEPFAIVKPKFIVDIRINKLIIQADGEYWHGHPRFDPLTERQIQQKKRDAAQDKYLKAAGYTVVRIWERDITPEYIADALSKPDIIEALRF